MGNFSRSRNESNPYGNTLGVESRHQESSQSASQPDSGMHLQTNVFRKALALLTGATLLILGFMFSVVVLAVGAILGLAVWGYLWWKTRRLRRAVQKQAADGLTIDGEAVVIEESRARTGNILPDDPSER